MKGKIMIWTGLLCELLLIFPENIPVYLHSQGKQYHNYQMVFFRDRETQKICIVILKGE